MRTENKNVWWYMVFLTNQDHTKYTFWTQERRTRISNNATPGTIRAGEIHIYDDAFDAYYTLPCIYIILDGTPDAGVPTGRSVRDKAMSILKAQGCVRDDDLLSQMKQLARERLQAFRALDK